MKNINPIELLKKLNNEGITYNQKDIPEGATCFWEITGPEDTIKFSFSDGAWWSVGKVKETKADKEAQDRLTKKYFENITKKPKALSRL